MAQIVLNTGTNPNDGTGEPLRGAAQSINNMMTELYALQSDTINAGAVAYAAATNHERIQLAIDDAVLTGKSRVYVPSQYLPYNASLVTFNSGVQMVREGGSYDVYDMLAYGVTLGDQTIGATPSHNAAVTAAIAAGGGTVLFPPGSYYYLTSPSTLSGVVGVTFQGAGRNAAFLVPNAEGVIIFRMIATCTRVFVRDLWIGRFAGMANLTSGGGLEAIAAGYPSNQVAELLFDNVTFQNLPYPVWLDNVTQSSFWRCRYLQTQVGATAGHCFYMIRTVTVHFADLAIFTTTGTLPGDAFRVDSDCDTIFCHWVENVLLGNGANTAGFRCVDSVGSSPPRIIRFTDCTAENGQVGFQVDAARDVRMEHCETANCNTYGYYITAGQSVDVVNSMAFLNQQHGIYVTGGSGILIEGNSCSNNSQAANATYDGIVIGTPLGARVINNKSGDFMVTTANRQRSGLNLTAPSDYLHVSGNELQGNVGLGFEQPIINNSTGTHNVFYGSAMQAPSEAALVAGLQTESVPQLTIAVTLSAARVVGAQFNPARGQRLTFVFLQNGTGGWAVTWNAQYKHAWSDTGNTMNKRSSISFVYDGTNYVQDGAQSPYI